LHQILIEKSAERDLKKLPSREFQRLVKQIKSLSGDPRPSGCRKITGSESDWRIRVGEYRIIYEIDDKQRIIRIMRVKHRREVYR
jgi:mRNA interferase RelE/StbE